LLTGLAAVAGLSLVFRGPILTYDVFALAVAAVSAVLVGVGVAEPARTLGQSKSGSVASLDERSPLWPALPAACSLVFLGVGTYTSWRVPKDARSAVVIAIPALLAMTALPYLVA
jgi:hypothetical protein